MLWNKLIQALFGSALVLAQPIGEPRQRVSPPADVHVGLNEIRSYSCGRNLTTLTQPESQVGPLFSQGHLVFTSIEASDLSKLLLVSAGFGHYVIRLEGEGVNRLRFTLPTGPNAVPTVYYLSYLHDSTRRSRFFEFAEGHPPVGKDEIEFAEVPVSRAENLEPHLEYAIQQTAASLLAAVARGQLSAINFDRLHVEDCENLNFGTPGLAINFRHTVNRLEVMLVTGPPPQLTYAQLHPAANRRMPASVGLSQAHGRTKF